MKLKNILLITACCLITACTEEVLEQDDWYNPNGVEYLNDGSWNFVHETEIDITCMPNEFTLEFKTFGVDRITVSSDGKVSASILDPITRDPETREILNTPFEYSEKQVAYKYLQNFKFNTNGEKRISVKFFYKWRTFDSDCTCTLVRKD